MLPFWGNVGNKIDGDRRVGRKVSWGDRSDCVAPATNTRAEVLIKSHPWIACTWSRIFIDAIKLRYTPIRPM